jgi:hypothetical protein
MTVNSQVIRALALGPASAPDDHIIDITTTGARTGQSRRIEIWLHRIDGHFYLTGMPVRRSWYANLCADPRFIVHLKRTVKVDLNASVLPVNDETRRRVIESVVSLQDLPAYAARGLPRQDVKVWQSNSPLVEVVFDDEDLQAAAAAAP